MPPIKREWCELIRSVIAASQEATEQQLVNPVTAELPGVSVRDLAPDFFKKLRELIALGSEIAIALGNPSSALPELPDNLVPLFKTLFVTVHWFESREGVGRLAR